jgi:DNA (cytosine-5)-methyltransferase 1
MNELALFAGAGGGILGGHLLGWRTVCAVEWEPYPASVLLARQNDGMLPPFPVWDDIQTFDGRPWRGIVDVVSGGFPCQDISAAGGGAGIEGERSGMWKEMARVICEVRPRFVFVENSPMLTSRGLGTVLGDLASLGFDAKWGVLGAADVGAPHQRDRIWIVAHASSIDGWDVLRGQLGESQESKSRNCGVDMAYPKNKRRQKDMGNAESTRFPSRNDGSWKIQPRGASCGITWWETEPDVGRVADGVAARVDRLKAIGNGQVPEVARRAWGAL